MKRILLLAFSMIMPFFVLAQVHLIEGEFKYFEDDSSSKWFEYSNKKKNELYSNASSYFDNMDNCSYSRLPNKIVVKAKVLDKHVKAFGKKHPLTVEYKISLLFKDGFVNVSCPEIEDVYLTNFSHQKLYMEIGSNSMSSIYMYKKNGEVRFEDFKNELTDYFNSILNGLQDVFKSLPDVFQEVWLDRDYMLYKNSLLKIKNGRVWNGFKNAFYFSLSDAMNRINVAYELRPNTTDIEKLKNRIFLVDTIIKVKENYLDIESSKIYFVLKDTLTQESLYYRYPVIEYDFPFLCYNVRTEYRKEDLLHKIAKKVDEFENTTRYYSEMNKKAVISKVIKEGSSTYYLSLKTVGQTLNVGEYGAWVIFDDGTKWHKPVEISVDAKEGSGWDYTCIVALTYEDLNLFSTKKIKKYKLYIYEDDIDELFSSKFKLYVEIIKGLN